MSGATFEPPDKPSDCDLDWGSAITVSAPGRGEFICHGDTVADPNAEVVPDGQEKAFGGFTCESEATGMTCRNDSTGHGFTVSGSAYRLF